MKNTSPIKKVAYMLLCGTTIIGATSVAQTAPTSTSPTNTTNILATSSAVSTQEATPKPFVKHIVSKLASIPDEKKNIHIETPLGSAAFSLYNKLSFSSTKTEATLKKLDEFLNSKEASNDSHIDTTKARFSYEVAKASLENANSALSQMSTMLEKWVNETSTTTFKKAVGSKKADFKNQAELARTNIKSANEAIKASVIAYKLAEKEFLGRQASSSTSAVSTKDQTIFDLASSSQKQESSATTLPLSEVSKTLKQ